MGDYVWGIVPHFVHTQTGYGSLYQIIIITYYCSLRPRGYTRYTIQAYKIKHKA